MTNFEYDNFSLFGIFREVKMHFLTIKLKTVKLLLIMTIVCVLLCIGFNGGASAEVFFGQSSRKIPVYNVATEQNKVAITFDSAWGAEKTDGILEILKEYDVNATFFLVGIWAEEYPEKVKAIHEAGIEIGTHSNTHPDLAKMSAEEIDAELDSSIEIIENITGEKPTLFRAPFGAYDNLLMEKCEERNLLPIQWNIDTLDWKGLDGKQMCERVTNKVENGSIILMHNNSDNILEGLRMILDRLKMQNFEVLSVGEIVLRENFEVDSQGVQHQK